MEKIIPVPLAMTTQEASMTVENHMAMENVLRAMEQGSTIRDLSISFYY